MGWETLYVLTEQLGTMGSAIVSRMVDTEVVCAPFEAVNRNLYLAPSSMVPAGISRWNGLSPASTPPNVVATPEAETFENTVHQATNSNIQYYRKVKLYFIPEIEVFFI